MLFHALILSLDVARAPGGGRASGQAGSRIRPGCARPAAPAAIRTEDAASRTVPARAGALAPEAHAGAGARKTWTRAERDEMNRFMEELAAENAPGRRPRAGRRALAMARTMTAPPLDPEEDARAVQRLAAARVSPFTLDMYFDAVFRKDEPQRRDDRQAPARARHQGGGGARW